MQLHFRAVGRLVERCSNERHPAARHYSIRYDPYHYSYGPSRNGVNGLRRAEIHSWRHFSTIRIVHFIVCCAMAHKEKKRCAPPAGMHELNEAITMTTISSLEL